MKLLAIDTALEACSVAVAAGGDEPVVISEVIVRPRGEDGRRPDRESKPRGEDGRRPDRESNKGHAERLFGMIEAAMAEAGLAFADLDRIAVTVGPGSFTGLRVGIAAARGLALVVRCPVVGLGTLAVHAEAARAVAGPVPVLALLDARRDELYGQRFAADGASAGVPEVGSASHFAALVERGDVLAGSGADAVVAALPQNFAPVVHRASAPDMHALVRLAMRAPAPAAPPRPLYLRPPDAKPQAEKRIATKRREAPSGATGKKDKRRGRPQAGPGGETKRRGRPQAGPGGETKRRGRPPGSRRRRARGQAPAGPGRETKRRGRPQAGPGRQR